MLLIARYVLFKSILIHEYQKKSTRVSTNQHESGTSQHESSRLHISQHESTGVS